MANDQPTQQGRDTSTSKNYMRLKNLKMRLNLAHFSLKKCTFEYETSLWRVTWLVRNHRWPSEDSGVGALIMLIHWWTPPPMVCVFYAKLCYAHSSVALPCSAMLCYALPCSAMQSPALLCQTPTVLSTPPSYVPTVTLPTFNAHTLCAPPSLKLQSVTYKWCPGFKTHTSLQLC